MHTSIRSTLRPALALASAFVLAASASGQVLQSWNFDDTAGTPLTGVANTGSASFATGIVGATTDGAGSLVIASNAAGAAARSFADIPDIGTGLYRLDVVVAGWDFTGSPSRGPLLEIGLSATTTNGNSSRLAHLYFEASDIGTVLAGVVASGNGTSTAGADDQLFSLVQATSVTFRLEVDFDALTYAVSNSSNGFTTPAAGTMANVGTRPASFVQIRALDDFTIGGTGGYFAIDSITLTAIPEPAGFSAFAGLAMLGLAVSRRRR